MTPRRALFDLRAKIAADAFAVMVDRNESYATEAEPIRNYVVAAGLAGIPTSTYIVARTAEKLVRMAQAASRCRCDVVDEEAREITNMVALVAFAVHGEGRVHENVNKMPDYGMNPPATGTSGAGSPG